jgi:hypothetical protein
LRQHCFARKIEAIRCTRESRVLHKTEFKQIGKQQTIIKINKMTAKFGMVFEHKLGHNCEKIVVPA